VPRRGSHPVTIDGDHIPPPPHIHCQPPPVATGSGTMLDPGSAPAWRNLRLPLNQLPPRADSVRLRAVVSTRDPAAWVALTPPRVPELQSLNTAVGSTQPVLMDWVVPLAFPCQRPYGVVHGIAEVPTLRITPDRALTIDTNAYQDAIGGGPLGWTGLVTSARTLPTYLANDWNRDWGSLQELVPLEPSAVPATLSTGSEVVTGWHYPGLVGECGSGRCVGLRGCALGDEGQQRTDRDGRIGGSIRLSQALSQPLSHEGGDFHPACGSCGAQSVEDRFRQPYRGGVHGFDIRSEGLFPDRLLSVGGQMSVVVLGEVDRPAVGGHGCQRPFRRTRAARWLSSRRRCRHATFYPAAGVAITTSARTASLARISVVPTVPAATDKHWWGVDASSNFPRKHAMWASLARPIGNLPLHQSA